MKMNDKEKQIYNQRADKLCHMLQMLVVFCGGILIGSLF